MTLHVDGLCTDYTRGGLRVRALTDFSIAVEPGVAVALVGESGSGKSTAVLSLMGLIRPPIGQVVSGTVTVNGRQLHGVSEAEARVIRRTSIGFVPQDPSTALDPLFTIRSQIAETMRREPGVDADQRIVQILESLGVARAAERLRSYPHEFSGGMQQRVAIAISLAKQPSVLIADEPTTALDVTTQVGILRLLNDLRLRQHLAMIFVTHDLAVARLVCQQIAVMYAGRIVEHGPTDAVLHGPRHPYTKALLDARPRSMKGRQRLQTIPGQPPTLSAAPARGCAFAPRCTRALPSCTSEQPPDVLVDSHRVSCFNPVPQ